MRPQAIRKILLLIGLFTVVGLTSVSAWAGTNEEKHPSVAVQVGPQDSELEQYAARELCGYLQKLYGIHTAPTDEIAAEARIAILIGSPTTNPAVAEALGPDGWPEVTDQGIVLKRAELDGKPVLVVGGGSPQATLWAVYDLVERWGVRYLLHGDVLPEDPGEFHLPEQDVVLEPKLRVRQWRVINDFACGAESWGMADYRPVLNQLAKLKFNRILVIVYPWQPFLHMEVDGIARRKAYLWYDMHFPITEDMPGRYLFDDRKEFWNPDLPLRASYKEFAAAGEKLVHGLVDHAHQRGMECGLTVPLPRFGMEFKELIKGSRVFNHFRRQTLVPGEETKLDDPGLIRVGAAMLQAAVETYPEFDFLAIGMPEKRSWVGQSEEAWKALDAKYGLSKVTSLEQLLNEARQRKGYPGGANRAVKEVKGDLAALYFYDSLIRESKVLQNARQGDMKVIYENVCEELFPVLEQILPAGSETLNFVDYTPARIIRRQDTLAALGGGEIPASLICTLNDDNIGLLPQLTTGSLHQLIREIRKHGWEGISTRYFLTGDQDPSVIYLGQVAWDDKVTPAVVRTGLTTDVCGKQCVADMLEAFEKLEEATVLLELHALSIGFPVPGMMMKNAHPKPLSATLVKVRNKYRQALAAAEQARAKTRPAGEVFVDYWIGRLKFGVGYIDCIEAVHQAATAESGLAEARDAVNTEFGDTEVVESRKAEVAKAWNKALEISRTMLEDYASVAVDQSDRGAVAVMAEFIYRPLKKKVQEAEAMP